MNLVDRVYNSSFDYIYNMIKQKKEEERRKQTIRLIFSI
jgi:hypothetical protein